MPLIKIEEIEGDADTVAGLLLELKGDFPVMNEKLEYKNYSFEIQDMDERRISGVKVVVGDRKDGNGEDNAADKD